MREGGKMKAGKKLWLLSAKLNYAKKIIPIYGSELYTDSSLEAAYTDGLCGSLVKSGTPTVSESADAYDGSKAQEFLATAQNDVVYKTRNSASQGWYRFSLFVKRLVGAAGNVKAYCSITTADAAYPDARQYVPITSAVYAEIVWTQWGDNARNIFVKEMSTTPFDSVVFDLFSVKKITFTSMIYHKRRCYRKCRINCSNQNARRHGYKS